MVCEGHSRAIRRVRFAAGARDLRLTPGIRGYRRRVAIDDSPHDDLREGFRGAIDDASVATVPVAATPVAEAPPLRRAVTAHDIDPLPETPVVPEQPAIRRGIGSLFDQRTADAPVTEAATALAGAALTDAPPADAPTGAEALAVPAPETPTSLEEAAGAAVEAPHAAVADAPRTDTAALAWIDPATVAPKPEAAPAPSPAFDLVPTRRERRPSVAAPLITAGVLALGYVGGCAFWPLANVAPAVSAATVDPAPGHPLAVTWPADGSAAVGAEGLGTVPASSAARAPMASIAKVVTALMILEKAPLAVGEQGPSYAFDYADSQEYWQYRVANESALDVPVDGTLTQRQLLEGILIGSANNYVDRLTTELWGSKDAFALAVPEWLQAHGLSGITMVDPSGIDPDNTATPASLVTLASLALANPVIAEIVAMPETELPGAGVVENSNPLIGDPGVVGIKTGTLSEWWIESWNLLTAKDVTIGQTTVRLYASVLGQPDEETRASVSRTLLEQVEQSLQPAPTVASGTTVANVTTEWGEPVEVVTGDDAEVVLWDRGTPEVQSDYEVEVGTASGAEVGTLTATGPFDSATVPLVLEGDLEGPSLLWRLSHPLDLLGLQ